jgi:hypothetical protein
MRTATMSPFAVVTRLVTLGASTVFARVGAEDVFIGPGQVYQGNAGVGTEKQVKRSW